MFAFGCRSDFALFSRGEKSAKTLVHSPLCSFHHGGCGAGSSTSCKYRNIGDLLHKLACAWVHNLFVGALLYSFLSNHKSRTFNLNCRNFLDFHLLCAGTLLSAVDGALLHSLL